MTDMTSTTRCAGATQCKSWDISCRARSPEGPSSINASASTLASRTIKILALRAADEHPRVQRRSPPSRRDCHPNARRTCATDPRCVPAWLRSRPDPAGTTAATDCETRPAWPTHHEPRPVHLGSAEQPCMHNTCTRALQPTPARQSSRVDHGPSFEVDLQPGVLLIFLIPQGFRRRFVTDRYRPTVTNAGGPGFAGLQRQPAVANHP